MRRAVILGCVIAASAWASAQGPGPGQSAGERMDRFARHQAAVEDMVARGLDLASANSPLQRVEVCHRAATDLGRSLTAAAQADDPARVAEIGEYLHLVLADALIPTLAEVRAPDGSPDADRLKAVRTAAVADTTRLEAGLPATGAVGRSQRVADLRGKLRDLGERLKAR